MPLIFGSCQLCGSDVDRDGCINSNCEGLSDTELALRRARDRYAQDLITIAQLEIEIWAALVNPRKVSRGPTIVYR